MLTLTALLKTAWLGLQGFVYYYPLFMSYLWMMGAALFYWRFERHDPPFDHPVALANTPPVSILIPCFNEGAHAEETLLHALATDYPDFEVIAINDGSRDNTGEILDRMVEGISLKTTVTAQDVADTILFLVSDAGRHISAQTIGVCGGARYLV